MTKPAEFQDFPDELAALAPYGPYRVIVKRVIDGDTFEAFFDPGINKYAFEAIRLANVWAPELKKGSPESRREGAAAKAFLESLLPVGTPLVIHTSKNRNTQETTTLARYVGDCISVAGSVNQKMREYLLKGAAPSSS